MMNWLKQFDFCSHGKFQMMPVYISSSYLGPFKTIFFLIRQSKVLGKIEKSSKMPPPPKKNEEDKIKKFSYCDEVANIVSVDWVLKDESPD